MEYGTDSLYLALAEKFYGCKRSEKRREWELFRGKNCNDSFTGDIFSPRTHVLY